MSRRYAGMVLVSFASAALAAELRIHLQTGVYVERGTPCGDAPFAVMKMWDGKGFSGAHSSHCVAHVVHASGSTFTIEDTCSALGDGTATPPETEAATVIVRDARSFQYARSSSDKAEYRWCARK